MNFKQGTCVNCQEETTVHKFEGGDICLPCVEDWLEELVEKAPEFENRDLGYLARQAIIGSGTEEDIQRLIDQESRRLQATDAEKAYAKKVNQPASQPAATTIGSAMRFITNKVKARHQARPESVTTEFVRGLFWRTYRLLVKEETSIDLKSDTVRRDPHLASSMRNFVHWILRSDAGEWDPNKSLYLWGNLGVGKSTLARSADAVLSYLNSRLGWEEASFNFYSMDQVFLEVYTTSNLDQIRSMGTGNLIIDELKEGHAKYRHYGNDLPILETILLSRHELWKRGKRTVITTNIKPAELSTYLENERLRSRMRQEYQNIEIKGDNKRSPKHRLKN